MDEHAVSGFRFWGDPSDPNTILELFRADETSACVFFPTETLTTFEDELTASLERSAQRRGEAGTGWPLRPLREPRKAGPEQEVLATRVHRVSFFEALDGSSIAIKFEHPDGTCTNALFSIDGAYQLLEHVRNRITAH